MAVVTGANFHLFRFFFFFKKCKGMNEKGGGRPKGTQLLCTHTLTNWFAQLLEKRNPPPHSVTIGCPQFSSRASESQTTPPQPQPLSALLFRAFIPVKGLTIRFHYFSRENLQWKHWHTKALWLPECHSASEKSVLFSLHCWDFRLSSLA